MNTITFMQAVELIDVAAKDNRLWHYNAGQAYIRVSNDSPALMIIDHTTLSQEPSITLNDGTKYFKDYAGAQFEYSRTRREGTPLTELFADVLLDAV